MCEITNFKNEHFDKFPVICDIDYSKYKTIIFIDLEYITTKYKVNGRRECLQEIVEMGIIVKKPKKIYKYTNIIKPRFYINHLKSNIDFTKFTLDELSNGVDLSKALLKLNNYYIPGETIIISWGTSDLYTINSICKKYRVKFNINQEDYIDLSKKFKYFFKFRKTLSLEKALCFMEMNEKYEKHRALPDTEMLVNIFEKMVSCGYEEDNLIKEKIKVLSDDNC